MLEQEGFEVSVAGDGAAALKLLQTTIPDLILLDVMMPELDGFSLLARIRDNHLTHNLPVIMLTAKGDIPDKVKGLQEGANDYLIKPFIPDELMLRVRNMLQLSRNQRDANPLSGLPGNRAIERTVNRRLDEGVPFGFLYLDLDNFKYYNDYYGYSRGDKLLTLLSDVLQRTVEEKGDGETFIGHVGGDDFVVIASVETAPVLADAIIETFDNQVRFLYEPEDWSRGYLEVKDRTGNMNKVNLVSLTIAMVLDEQGTYGHVGKLNSIAVELKRFGKSQPGSIVVNERRVKEADPTYGSVKQGVGEEEH